MKKSKRAYICISPPGDPYKERAAQSSWTELGFSHCDPCGKTKTTVGKRKRQQRAHDNTTHLPLSIREYTSVVFSLYNSASILEAPKVGA